MIIKKNIFIPLLTACIITHSYAENLGVQGSVYRIVEPDMLTAIYQKLEKMQQDGTLAQQQHDFIARSIQHVLRPPSVSGVTDLASGVAPSKHYYDPSIIVNKDITNANGFVIAHKDMMINPLANMHFDEKLIFINGDNNLQINWVNKIIKKYNQENISYKVILVNGDIKKTSYAINNRVYFDQFGRLCSKFGILHTPSLVFQPIENRSYLPKLIVQEVQIA
jgi:conjugal transfer pilus assembly protein TraW